MRLSWWLLSPIALVLSTKADSDPDKKAKRDAEKLPPCGACTNLVRSFELGLERTKRGKFEGGDTAWEEKTQPRYATSEVRFVEVTEELCRGVERGEAQCHANHNSWEELLEKFWALDPGTRPGLCQWLCVDQLQVCCPLDHFGPGCAPCEARGANGEVCSGSGKCKGVTRFFLHLKNMKKTVYYSLGSGTRKGNGKCACDAGYIGEMCDVCDNGYYESFKDDTKRLCSPCHKSCNGPCSGPGPKTCAKCADGYTMHVEHGCMVSKNLIYATNVDTWVQM